MFCYKRSKKGLFCTIFHSAQSATYTLSGILLEIIYLKIKFLKFLNTYVYDMNNILMCVECQYFI